MSDDAPDDTEIAQLLHALVGIADHAGLRPWRVIALRGDARNRLGDALAMASDGSPEKYRAKATRAPLLLAIAVSPVANKKVPLWEQEAVASGVAHALTLLLDEAGWACMWRTGLQTRTDAVRAVHGLRAEENLLGWLYVGGKPEAGMRKPPKPRAPLDLDRHFTSLK